MPRSCPAPLAACAQGAWLALAALCTERLDPAMDAFRLLGERAAIAGLVRRGRVSAGRACRLLETADGMLAINLAREADRELLPAWLQQSHVDDVALDWLLRERCRDELLARARLLGLAAAPVVPPRACAGWFRAGRHGRSERHGTKTPLVIDLSALWAGPLCAQLLSQCGARVVKVESVARPDGARFGPGEFFDLLNAGKESVVLELRSAEGRGRLVQLLQRADIVIESSRPRALEQMGIRAADIVAGRPGMVWLAISGYGRDAPMRDWIAYGDDAGVAAGLSWLVGERGLDPVFCGDAIADPLAGLHAALLVIAAWRSGGGLLLDLALHDVAAWCIAVGAVAEDPAAAVQVEQPRARPRHAYAGPAGSDTARVMREFAVGRA